MDMTINRPKIYDDITKKCLEIFDDGQSLTVDEILMQLMDLPGVPMHDPFHHYIMPAASLVAAAIETQVLSEFAEENPGLKLKVNDDIRCHYYKNNKECLGKECPFFIVRG